MGIAILKGSDLLDWGVKVVSGKWSERKLEKIRTMASRLIEEHEPDALAMKKLHPSRSSQNLARLSKEIEELAGENHLRIRRYSLREMGEFYAPGQRISKKRIAGYACSTYPVLLRVLHNEHSHNNPYHIKMFEAVALGVMAAAKTRQ